MLSCVCEFFFRLGSLAQTGRTPPHAKRWPPSHASIARFALWSAALLRRFE
jgi:hypothetical protein